MPLYLCCFFHFKAEMVNISWTTKEGSYRSGQPDLVNCATAPFSFVQALLLFDVFPDRFLIQPYCADIVPFDPKVPIAELVF